MIDPVIFSIDIGAFHLAVHWYGIIIVTALMVGAWTTQREIHRRGGDPDLVWNAIVWVVLAGIVGARLWFVANSLAGGNPYYLENPLQIINIPAGGLHIFGGFLFGGIVVLIYLRRNKIDPWLVLDSVAPALLIGQALARPANFINQELYGPPTTLPWGIPIDAAHRISPWTDLVSFPETTTRFHPTFAYEMIWNLIAAAVLLYVAHRWAARLKPGLIFAGWLIAAGLGRFLIEAFRPDQPRIPGLDISFSRVGAGLMCLAGIGLLLFLSGAVRQRFADRAARKPDSAT